MPSIDPMSIFDAARSAAARTAMETTLGTSGLREKGMQILARSAFTARGSNAIYASELKRIIDELSSGNISEGQARTALWECLKALGYTPEGGFPDAPPGEVPPAVAGSLQDLSSFQRRDLIVSTQIDLMRGVGQQTRGHTPDRLRQFPAWELVRVSSSKAPRHWGGVEMGGPKDALTVPRWTIAGGRLAAGKMVAFKGDPVWGELGHYENFDDALGVDHPPFAFNSGMGWREVGADEAERLGVSGPHFETADEWFAKAPIVMAGKLPLPTPQISFADVDPDIIEAFKKSTDATANAANPAVLSYDDALERDLAKYRAAYLEKNPGYDFNYGKGGGA